MAEAAGAVRESEKTRVRPARRASVPNAIKFRDFARLRPRRVRVASRSRRTHRCADPRPKRMRRALATIAADAARRARGSFASTSAAVQPLDAFLAFPSTAAPRALRPRALASDAASDAASGSIITPALEVRLETMRARHDELCAALVATPPPAPDAMAKINKELARAERVVSAYAALRDARDEMTSLASMFESPDAPADAPADAELARMARDEHDELASRIPALEESLAHLLLPADDADENGAIVEVRAGAGGDEAALFAQDLLRMYELHARKRGWRWETLAVSPADAGGFKEASVSVAGDDVYGALKFESGVHRVQRVPATETQGRVHTSTASVAVMPHAEEVDLEVRDEDVRVDTMRASGAGGQHVNTTNSAVRLTHAPTGVVVVIQDERSQHKNKDKAMKVLRARLYELERRRLHETRADLRKSLVGSGDRSERVRTYNYKEGRVKDHRVNVQINDLSGMMDGGESLGEMIEALRLEERRRALLDFA